LYSVFGDALNDGLYKTNLTFKHLNHKHQAFSSQM